MSLLFEKGKGTQKDPLQVSVKKRVRIPVFISIQLKVRIPSIQFSSLKVRKT